jgi:hypothetical protein
MRIAMDVSNDKISGLREYFGTVDGLGCYYLFLFFESKIGGPANPLFHPAMLLRQFA